MKARIGILCSCFSMLCYLCISPVIANIAEEFPQVNVALVQMLITIPALVAIVMSLVAGKLAQYFYKKTLILWAIGAMMVGAYIPLFFNNNVYVLLAGSAIIGLGLGTMVTITATIICDCFEGDQRNQMMGFQSAFISGGAMIFTLIGGWLARFGWRATYLAFLLLIPCFIISAICLPKGNIDKKSSETESGKLPGILWFMVAVSFIFLVFQNAFNTNVSLYVSEAGLGDAGKASIATSVYSFAGMITGCLLQFIMKKLKNYTISFSFIFAAIGFTLTFIGGNIIMVVLGGLFVGVGFAAYTPAANCIVSDHMATYQRSLGLAILSCSTHVGEALSPIIVNSLSGVFAPTVQVKFIVTAVILAVTAIVSIGYFKVKKS